MLNATLGNHDLSGRLPAMLTLPSFYSRAFSKHTQEASPSSVQRELGKQTAMYGTQQTNNAEGTTR